jgi:phosphoenolpyruvate carboxylase
MVFAKKKNLFENSIQNALIKLGFWPGGDRDEIPLLQTKLL